MIIQSKRVYFEEKLQPKQIEIRKDKIVGVYPYGLFQADKENEAFFAVLLLFSTSTPDLP